MTHPSPDTGLSDALSGQYAIEREIGRGGMGVVYLARDLKLDRLVAIKTLPVHLARDSAIRERFLREARTAASLSHPNIVPVHRADETIDHVFFVMAHVDGESLAARIRDRGPLDPGDVARYLGDVATGLAYAHARQVVHRDVKAENILIDSGADRAVITDFGIARLAEAAPLTATGQMLGTVYYLSPEQITGGVVDHRSDIYALGVTGYFALTGRFPFDGALASAVLVAHVNQPAPTLGSRAPRVPAALAAIIERCLAKDPAARFQSCDELRSSLHEAISRVPRLDRLAPRADAGAGLVSETECRAILHRAAELDGQTSAHPRPLVLAPPRDLASDMARTSGLQVDQLRGAAIEAGIAPRHVERALLEHGLATGDTIAAAPREISAVTDLSTGSKTLAGTHTELRYELVVDGEMPTRDFDILAEILRRRTDNTGEVLLSGRSWSWTADRPSVLFRPIGRPSHRPVEVAVLPANGKTSIFIRESLATDLHHALLWSVVLTMIAWGLTSEVLTGPNGMGQTLTDVWLALCGIEAAGIAVGVRRLFGRLSEKRQTFLRSLAETLGAHARDAATTLAKPRSNEGRLGAGSKPRLKSSSSGVLT